MSVKLLTEHNLEFLCLKGGYASSSESTLVKIPHFWKSHIGSYYSSILLKEPFALKNSETVYFASIFSTLGYSDITLIDNFDLIFFYFYFVFENFGYISVLTP